ncbi:uncharacterized protein LOC128873935 isoform X1 [Hylaeus volcanicus]|uniref:uncharacterized protein LOC128873935 isoform X1 n=1 Tax=Hylaeus volcanicus TaxID=313075 RepID=UPI0023B81D62|nr:uncharacterized protein LOC128873935 isoform X1 [Hylaeus volcanicus]XP_053973965.1 uncharacterized protein LOC128873935 isoform X1 [Hylaeus volcanicus]XP_053973966.1 uncharacterized protein LOC128873935 isoform X1 [Hylaeus volcanicus]
MDDQELIALQNLKAKLLKEANDLTEELRKQETDDEQFVALKIRPSSKKSTLHDLGTNLLDQNKQLLCEITSKISGITFEDIEKKWLRKNIYQYTTHLVTTTVQFLLQLIVKLEKEKEFEIHDIVCHPINVNKCYMLEIQPWMENISRMNNFSLLTSAISQYNQEIIVRKKILSDLQVKRYVNCKDCTKKKGGISVSIHSPKNVEQIYLNLQWSLLFVERTLQIQHFFFIVPLETGAAFAKENMDLLNNVHEVSLEKEDITRFWKELIDAINEYEKKRK